MCGPATGLQHAHAPRRLLTAVGTRAPAATPYTLNPCILPLPITPHTLHPTPSILHPTPYPLPPNPYTLHPKPETRNPKPETLGCADRRDYDSAVAAAYRASGTRWFTPAELFRPHYGAALAAHFLAARDAAAPLRIYEVGGGSGTAAKDILDHIRSAAPEVYRRWRPNRLPPTLGFLGFKLGFTHRSYPFCLKLQILKPQPMAVMLCSMV